MHILKLKIGDQVYGKLLRQLSKFPKEEVEIVMEEPNFAETKKYLEAELEEVTSGKAKFLTVDEAEQQLETRIKRHEDHL
jgi:hypothetical protein